MAKIKEKCFKYYKKLILIDNASFEKLNEKFYLQC